MSQKEQNTDKKYKIVVIGAILTAIIGLIINTQQSRFNTFFDKDGTKIEDNRDVTVCENQLKKNATPELTPLCAPLVTRNFKIATQETFNILSEIVHGKNNHEYISAKSIEKLGCQPLIGIDKLWQKHSENHFGFSAQLEVWKQANNYIDFTSHKYVGWRFGDSKLWRNEQKDFMFNLKAPKGHLPTLWIPTKRDSPPGTYGDEHKRFFDFFESCTSK